MEQKISGCICSQQAQLSCSQLRQQILLGERGENQSGSLLRAAPGPGQASPPLGTAGTRGWEGEGAGKAVPARKKDTGETKGKLLPLKGISFGKKHLHSAAPAQASRPRSKSHKLFLQCRDGESSCPPTSSPAAGLSFLWSREKGELIKPKVWELQDPAPLGRRGARADPDPNPALG